MVKERVLALFESAKEQYLSGEAIAARLEVSRTAVWKAVEQLRQDGCNIVAATNKGYALMGDADILSAEGIRRYLAPGGPDYTIELVAKATSTNLLVREKAVAGAPEGYLLVAAEQTQGRGRLGRSFCSPGKTGVYLSLLLRPGDTAAQITTMAAVAVCQALEALGCPRAEIKWVNDIFVGGKKVCGILTEAAFGMENGLLDYAVLGVGVNLYPPDGGFPKELEKIAGAVFDTPQKDNKNRFVAEFLGAFMDCYRAPGHGDYAEKYRARSFAIGRQVTLVSPGGTQTALVLGIDDDCHLLVRYPDGRESAVFSGEISLVL